MMLANLDLDVLLNDLKNPNSETYKKFMNDKVFAAYLMELVRIKNQQTQLKATIESNVARDEALEKEAQHEKAKKEDARVHTEQQQAQQQAALESQRQEQARIAQLTAFA